MNSVSKRGDCRLCLSGKLDAAFELVSTPPANELLYSNQLDASQEEFPLEMMSCRDCGHVQLSHVVDPERLFRNYLYVSGTSPVFVEHFRKYAEEVLGTVKAKANSLVIDIGSNDGTLLRFYKDAGHRVLGIDPAKQISHNATASGIPTNCAFFTSDYARELLSEHGQPLIITANNVFAHADDLRDIVEGISLLLNDTGVFVFEVSYLLDVLQQNLFDTIYHEHVSYHSIKPLVSLMDSMGMNLFKVTLVPSHGGSIRCYAQKSGGHYELDSGVKHLVEKEIQAGLYDITTYAAYIAKIRNIGGELKGFLEKLKSRGKRIAGFGAPAKATTLMYQFGIGPEHIDYIIDDSPLKQGLFSPGKKIPIVASDALQDEKTRPDYLLILAWNFAETIINKNESFSRSGGKFIVPIPELKII